MIDIQPAHEIAQDLIAVLALYCDRLAIAGSLRRRLDAGHELVKIKDIELVAIPKRSPGLFEQLEAWHPNQLSLKLDTMAANRQIEKGRAWGARQRQFTYQEAPIDLYLVYPPAEWGVIFTIRTGPADFGHWLVTRKRQGGALPRYMKVKDGRLLQNGKALPCPEEHDFFKWLGIPWCRPSERAARWPVRSR